MKRTVAITPYVHPHLANEGEQPWRVALKAVLSDRQDRGFRGGRTATAAGGLVFFQQCGKFNTIM